MHSTYIDLDGTIADLQTPWAKWISERIELPFTVEDITQYDVVQCVMAVLKKHNIYIYGDSTIIEESSIDAIPNKPFDIHVVSRIVYSFLDQPGCFRDLEPYPDAIETIKLWMDNGVDVAIASCPAGRSGSAAEKIDWVREHLGSKIPIILIKDKWRLSAGRGSYALIDDSPDQFLYWKGLKIVMDRPWNRVYIEGAKRWNGWGSGESMK